MARATKSFTLRMPEEIYNELEKQAGEGKRSEFVLELLRRELGFSVEPKPAAISSGSESLIELELKYETLKTVQDRVLQRLAEIEKWVGSQKTVPQDKSKTDSKTLKDTDVSKTEGKTLSNNQIQEETLELFPEEIPKGAVQKLTNELVDILKEEQPEEGWNWEKLRSYREYSKKKKSHVVGKCWFKYSKIENADSKQKNQHYWWVKYPYDIK